MFWATLYIRVYYTCILYCVYIYYIQLNNANRLCIKGLHYFRRYINTNLKQQFPNQVSRYKLIHDPQGEPRMNNFTVTSKFLLYKYLQCNVYKITLEIAIKELSCNPSQKPLLRPYA